jgi:L-glutamine-phosphate cytidylyltransferase
MRGVILAAGKGTRLNGTIGDKPKCLLRVGGKTLVERQIDAFRRVGIEDIVMVVGCQAEAVRRTCGQPITYIENPRFAQTNSLYSLWLARPLLYDGFVVMNCDVLFHPQLLVDLVTSRHEDALLIAYQDDDDAPMGDEEMKIKVRRGRVVDIAKTLPADEADGENVGIVKFGADGARLLVDLMEQRVAAGGLRDWAPRAFADFARLRPLFTVGTRAFPWTEIDFPEDYERAVRAVLPAIEGDEGAAAGEPRRPPTTVIDHRDATTVVRGVRLKAGSNARPLASGE